MTLDDKVLESLNELHRRVFKIGLISNADVIDSKYWYVSPLAEFFDSVIFSCNIGILKPNVESCNFAMKRLYDA